MRILPGLVFIVTLLSCTSDYDLPIPYTGKQIVLNGILNPDSILKVKLSFSQELTETTPAEAIENASVKVLENGNRLIELYHNLDGEYISTVRVLSGNSYKVIANVSGYAEVEAEDIVPQEPVISACYRQRVIDNSYDVLINLDVVNDPNLKNRYWFDTSVRDYISKHSTETALTKLYYITCEDFFLDNFNSSYDNTDQNFYYTLFMRQSDESKSTNRFQLAITGADGNPFFRYETLQNLDENQGLFVNTYNCSAAYDQFLKSTLTEFLNEELYGMSNPINGPVKIFSNVKNGLGIFGAYSLKTIDINEYLCN